MDKVRESTLRSQLLFRKERLQRAASDEPLNHQIASLLQQVDGALERIDSNTYGICEQCHAPIEAGYLRADPLVRICLAHLSSEQQRAIERDLELASTIQAKLLPARDIHIDGWEILYRYEPLGPVSGDFCDVIPSEAGEGTIIFGDVSGKGVAAALLMSHLHAIFRSLTNLSPDNLVERANKVFSESTLTTHFATLVCGKISPSGILEICNAGHCRPILVRNGETSEIESTGRPVGIFEETGCRAQTFSLERGDTLLLYTDGLSEAQDRSGEEYGSERLRGFLSKNHFLAAGALLAGCLDDVRKFRDGFDRADDLTMMVIRRTG